VVRSTIFLIKYILENPNITLAHDLKKNVGPNRYKNISKNNDNKGYKSKKKEKNKNSETNNIDPGKPKNTNVLNNTTKNNLGVKKLIPLISVIKRVLNRLLIASTSKKELVDNNA
jgi:hypothetical protein